MEEAIVLYPSPPIGHLISMVELGKLLLTQKPSLCIHILITSVPYDSGSTAPYIANAAATIPSIKFHHLPTVTLPSTKTTHHEELTFEVLRLSNPHVREQLLSISKNCRWEKPLVVALKHSEGIKHTVLLQEQKLTIN